MPRKISHLTAYDSVSERMIISGLLQHGSKLFYDVDSFLKEVDFYQPENKIIFGTLRKLIVSDKMEKPDMASIIAFVKSTDETSIRNYDLVDYLTALTQESIPVNNVLPFCKRVKKLSLVRNLKARLDIAKGKLDEVTGEESLLDIIAVAEKPIIEFTDDITKNSDTINIGANVKNYLNEVKQAKPGFRGVPSGWDIYDKCIGGGFRKPGVHILGARVKIGKTFSCVKISDNVTKLGIPVLYLDTEMTEDIITSYFLASISNVTIDDIQTGLKTTDNCKELIHAVAESEKRRFYYHNISGLNHSVWISAIRRWIMREVGFNPDGTAKDCLVVLDYLKTMDTKDFGDLQEYQYLGQVITDLHNVAKQYNIPIFSTVQLNREGINSSGQGVVAGSDRIIALCSSFSILRKKDQADFVQCPPSTGDRKLQVIACRYGPGLDDSQYINLKTDLSRCYFEETVLNSAYKPNVEQNEGLVNKTQNDDSETI